MHTMDNNNDGYSQALGGVQRSGIMAYAVTSYFIGVVGLAALILAMAGLIPLGHLLAIVDGGGAAVAINIGLLMLFALQHSIMARPAYKAWSARHMHKSLDRANYVLASGVATLVLVAFWQPLDSTVWQATDNGALALWGLFAFGWAYLFAATFAIDHFDLFGLRQAWFAFRGETYQPVPFKQHWMYRFSRHPIMLGVLIGIWFVPHMDGSKLMMAIGLSVYMMIGLYFEERDLIKQWGKRYEDYRKDVGALWTFRRG